MGELPRRQGRTRRFDWIQQDVRRAYLIVGGVMCLAVFGSLLLGLRAARRISRRLFESINAISEPVWQKFSRNLQAFS
ncbi:MAG: hypothetical protein N838_22135 [Thiohalocapsa sp. PB-PSB1]|jgi:hypothetical protein|nr:MAG: hypothetical protein N838_05910 [Thiohalocapsa sp. PB-PSB1]QQO55641.1 MAG: hypothetical protein N838_22135 [Thiohalocapsa sp. PB-PSB1]HCS93045.1 hypothetical protein [Chromatiaceae bacterium]